MRMGSDPTTADEWMRARGSRPKRSQASADASSRAEEASLIWPDPLVPLETPEGHDLGVESALGPGPVGADVALERERLERLP
jgi:hypothetical protein